MKRANEAGPAPLGARPPLRAFAPDELARRADLVVVDTRSLDAHHADHVPGAYFVPEGKKLATYGSYVIVPETETRGLVVVAGDEDQAAWIRDRLAWTGIDGVVGYVATVDGLTAGPAPRATPDELGERHPFLLDVRTKAEHAAGAIPGALQRHVGRVAFVHDDLPRDRPIVVYCQTGIRSAVAAAALRALGFEDVRELAGSYDGWREARHSAPVGA
jgi:hydroxyacylglutathione hydrolase